MQTHIVTLTHIHTYIDKHALKIRKFTQNRDLLFLSTFYLYIISNQTSIEQISLKLIHPLSATTLSFHCNKHSTIFEKKKPKGFTVLKNIDKHIVSI